MNATIVPNTQVKPATFVRSIVMLIEVTQRCTGHGRCYSVAPAVFDADDEGYNVAIGTRITVPDELESAARAGVASCPEAALVVVDEPAN
jgi:ferredoxin